MTLLRAWLWRIGWATIFAVGSTRGAEHVWRLDNLEKIGGHTVAIIGAPRIVTDEEGKRAVQFDGIKDGLLLPAIPFADARQFTIEIMFHPTESGLPEQRFLHAQDNHESRALIETRLDGRGGWWLDTFIVNGPSGPGVTLIDPKRVHRTGQWYWAALRYDGKKMSHFVNGIKELERDVTFKPFGPGQTSLGVRQNKVYWFKGAIREVRFHTEAVPEEKLQRVK